MRVFMRKLDLSGQPLPGEGDAYSGGTPLDVCARHARIGHFPSAPERR